MIPFYRTSTRDESSERRRNQYTSTRIKRRHYVQASALCEPRAWAQSTMSRESCKDVQTAVISNILLRTLPTESRGQFCTQLSMYMKNVFEVTHRNERQNSYTNNRIKTLWKQTEVKNPLVHCGRVKNGDDM